MTRLRELNAKVRNLHLARLRSKRPVCALAVFALGLLPSGCRGAAPSIRVVSYNIKHAHGMDGEVNLPRIAETLRALAPDVILLQEVDQGCARSSGIDQAAWLGASLDMEAHFGPFRPYDGGLYGMAILSRIPVLASAVVPLPPGPNPLSALEVSLAVETGPITVTGLHLVQTEQQRLAQAEFLVDRYAAWPEPVLLAGDLNSEPASAVLAALQTTFQAPAKDPSPLTFPSEAPVKEIDFVLLSESPRWRVRGHRVVDERIASDHRPVVLDVDVSR